MKIDFFFYKKIMLKNVKKKKSIKQSPLWTQGQWTK